MSGEVEIRWSILEQNDGGVLQIVYVGDEGVKIQAHSILEGQPEVVRLDYEISQSTPGEVYAHRQGWKVRIPIYFFIAMGFVMTGMFASRLSITPQDVECDDGELLEITN